MDQFDCICDLCNDVDESVKNVKIKVNSGYIELRVCLDCRKKMATLASSKNSPYGVPPREMGWLD